MPLTWIVKRLKMCATGWLGDLPCHEEKTKNMQLCDPLLKPWTFIAVMSLGLAGCATRSGPAHQSEPMYRGKALSSWVMELQFCDPGDIDFKPHADVVKAIRAIGPPAVPYLLTWLLLPDGPPPYATWAGDPSLVSRLPSYPTTFEVANAFRVLGTQGTSAIPVLERIVSGTPTGSAGYSSFVDGCSALSFLGPEAVPAMIRAAKRHQNRDVDSESHLILQLGWTGTNGEAAIPPLTVWAKDKDKQIRSAAIQSLGAIKRRPDLAAPVLIAALNDSDSYIRIAAAYSLVQFRGDAKAAIPQLCRLVDGPDSRVRSSAILSLGEIGGEPDIIVPLLIRQLKDEDFAIRMSAATALGDMGGKAAFDALMQSTDDPNKWVRESVFASLKKINPEALKKSGKVAD